jgi:hypothetical protein
MKLALLVLFVAASAHAQPKPPAITPQQRAAANDAFQRADWAAAAKAYEALVAVEDHPMQHGRLGMALVELNKPREAIAHLEKGLATIPNPRFALYLARAHAQLGATDAAFTALDKMVTLGGVPAAQVKDQRDFAKLAGKRFTDLLAKNLAAVEPCRAAPEYRQFDFWIGEWIVKDPKGNVAGTSSVQRILGDCTIFENWTGNAGMTGKSFNIYDARDKKWHQTWVDDRGTFTHYIGGLVDGKLVVTADQSAPGKPSLVRMTFSKLTGGEVRQFGEASTDGGKTWTTQYDLIYSKRP